MHKNFCQNIFKASQKYITVSSIISQLCRPQVRKYHRVQGKEIYIMIIYHTTLEIKDMSRKTKDSGCRDT